MKFAVIVSICVACLWACIAPADEPSGDACKTCPSFTMPDPVVPGTTTAPAGDPALALLKRLELAGTKYQTLRAVISYRVDLVLLGDVQRRTGYVLFQNAAKDRPARFRVHFRTLQLGDREPTLEQVDYAFDGKWLQVAKHKQRQITRKEYDTPGDKADVLRLGRGPFPLPFGQKVEDVLAFFEPSTREPGPKDPPNTVYLKLVTRRERRKDTAFRQMELWIDPKTDLPVRIAVREKSRNIKTVEFAKIELNVQPKDEAFSLTRSRGWRVTTLKKDDKLEFDLK